MKNKMNIWNVNWETNTAGPSPDANNRVEIFTKGCDKAIEDPCVGCFNRELWDSTTDTYHDPVGMAQHIAKHAPNKYVSISGGEPLDQLSGLTELCSELKRLGFHILVYTHHELKYLLYTDKSTELEMQGLLKNIDILVDGPYIESLNMYDLNKDDGLHNSVGSINQTIWDIRSYNNGDSNEVFGMKGGSLDALALDHNNNLVFISKDGKSMETMIVYKEVA